MLVTHIEDDEEEFFIELDQLGIWQIRQRRIEIKRQADLRQLKILRRRAQETIDVMRTAGRVIEVNQSNQVRVRKRALNMKNVKRVMQKLKIFVDYYDKSCKELKVELLKMTRYMEQRVQDTRELVEMMEENEIDFTEAIPQQPDLNLFKPSEREVLLNEQESLKSQYKCMRTLLAIAMGEADEQEEKVMQVKGEIQGIYDHYQEQKDMLELEFVNQHGKLMREISEFKSRMAEYQKDSDLEVDIRRIIQSRQATVMEHLQTELQSAKLVCQTPRIRLKIMQRLHDISPAIRQGPRKRFSFSQQTSPFQSKNTGRLVSTAYTSQKHVRNVRSSSSQDSVKIAEFLRSQVKRKRKRIRFSA